MEKKLSNGEKDNSKDKNRLRQHLNALRGMAVAGAAALAIKTGDGKTAAPQPETDRRVEPVSAPAPVPTPDKTPTASWPGLEPSAPMPDISPAPNAIPVPEFSARPAELDIPSSPLPEPRINVSPADNEPDYDYESNREICRDMHYEICVDMLSECEEYGYGSKDLDYGDKLDLAVAATEVEMSRIMSEDLVPAMDGVVQTVDGMAGVLDDFEKNPDNRREIRRGIRDMTQTSRRAAGKTLRAQRKMLSLAKETIDLYKLSEQYDATGEKKGERKLDAKISGAYRHADNFVKKYEKENFSDGTEKDNDAKGLAGFVQQKIVDRFFDR